jgi:hypothetical protein
LTERRSIVLSRVCDAQTHTQTHTHTHTHTHTQPLCARAR